MPASVGKHHLDRSVGFEENRFFESLRIDQVSRGKPAALECHSQPWLCRVVVRSWVRAGRIVGVDVDEGRSSGSSNFKCEVRFEV